MNGTFNNGLDVLYHHAKFGERTTRAGCRCKNIMFAFSFFLSCSEAGALLVRRRHILNKYCVTAYGTISILFSLFLFRMDSPFSQTNNNNTSICKAHNVSIRAESEAPCFRISVASWRHNFREIAVENCEKCTIDS